MKTRIIKNEKGFSLVFLALSIVVLFGFAALAIDVGHLYNVKNQLQVSADAAALAGAALLSGDNLTQSAARAEAQAIASQNRADVAYDNSVPGVNEGEQIPVSLDANTANVVAGDIVVGNWNPSRALGDQFHPGESPVNAVKVVARRTGANPSQPNVQNWFARVLKLIPGDQVQDFSLANVTATAIAAKGGLPLLPIAVNEYWDEKLDPKDCTPLKSEPYRIENGQFYPNSFMREINVDGTPSQMAGKTFAVLGVRANSNNSSFNLDSFVDILYRNANHTPLPGSWYRVQNTSVTGSCSPSCAANLTPLSGVSTGNVSNERNSNGLPFLFQGIPDTIIPPNAVRELPRDPVDCYSSDNYSAANGNNPSECPYASVPYFPSSGSGPVNKKFDTDDPDFAFNGLRFWERYRQEDDPQFMVMIYDGSLTANPDPSQANVVTIVGYGIIEIDGYQSGPFNGNASSLIFRGSTAYGHVIPHGLPGTDDIYIIQPSDADRTPDCSFTDKLRQLQDSFGQTRLVDSSIKYGVK